jgi:hypothetical protein
MKIQGIISLESGDYLFRSDHCGEVKYWAWKIESDITISERSQCYKWTKLPRSKKSSFAGHIELFNFDNPPRTLRYIPQLD